MTIMSTVKPRGGWSPGDRAYCVRGSMLTKPPLIAGRVYVIDEVIPVRAMVDQGVTLKGVLVPDGNRGMWGGRFVKLRPGRRALDEIASHTTPKSCDAYQMSTGQAPHPDDA